MNKYLKYLFTRKKWELIESHTGVWNLSHGVQGGLTQKFIFYKLEYCEKIDEYRLTWEGEDGDKNVMYGEMLVRLAALNTGTPVPLSTFTHPVSDIDSIVITRFPLSNEAEEVFKFSKDDEKLIEAITNIKKNLEKQGIEVYNQKFNIIATDKGYYAAFYESDIKRVDPSDLDSEEDNKEE